MARPQSRTLTDVELEIMQVLWQCEEATVPAVAEGLARSGHPLAQPSIRTMLGILHKKGYVDRRTAKGRGFAYRALVTQKQTQKRFVETVIDRVFGGSPMALVSALLQNEKVSEKDLDRVQRMIRDNRKRGKK